jgi:acyl-CoA reductase-like NAD-dependent aldehyde dehydrogenase
MEVAVAKRTASSVIAHPVRVQILMIANERDISPSRYVEEVMGFTPADKTESYKRGLSYASYHFKELAKAGCIEVVDRIPRRGSVEHVYRSVTRAEFTEDEWAKLPADERCRILTIAWQGLMVKTEAARLAHTLDGRDGTSVAWTDANLDERGWAELTTTIAANYAEMEQIRKDAESRLAETKDESIPVTFATLAFERPSGVFYDALPPAKEK